VFDGEAPKLKEYERERRALGKLEAARLYEEAKLKEDVEAMRKYAARTSQLTSEMIEHAKEVLRALGIPIVQAPSEGEAQAAYMVEKGLGYAVVSEDTDSLLFGVPRLVKGLSITRKRKERDKLSYKKTEIELIELEQVLNELGINLDQLIALAMLVGTDFNPGGIPNIGQKRALMLVKQYPKLEELFRVVNWDNYFSYSWEEVFNIFKKTPHTDKFELKWRKPDRVALYNLLVDKFEFSQDKVNKKLEELEKVYGAMQQSSLDSFFRK